MLLWIFQGNLHIFSNHGVNSSKLKVCYVGESCKMLDILDYTLSNTKLNIEMICSVLWKYLKKGKLV